MLDCVNQIVTLAKSEFKIFFHVGNVACKQALHFKWQEKQSARACVSELASFFMCYSQMSSHEISPTRTAYSYRTAKANVIHTIITDNIYQLVIIWDTIMT